MSECEDGLEQNVEECDKRCPSGPTQEQEELKQDGGGEAGQQLWVHSPLNHQDTDC